jgi:hypothetical protein
MKRGIMGYDNIELTLLACYRRAATRSQGAFVDSRGEPPPQSGHRVSVITRSRERSGRAYRSNLGCDSFATFQLVFIERELGVPQGNRTTQLRHPDDENGDGRLFIECVCKVPLDQAISLAACASRATLSISDYMSSRVEPSSIRGVPRGINASIAASM